MNKNIEKLLQELSAEAMTLRNVRQPVPEGYQLRWTEDRTNYQSPRLIATLMKL